jgi:hypothetical protein
MEEILSSWIRRCNTIKMAMLPKFICRFNVFFIKIPAGLVVVENDMLILKFPFMSTCKYKGPITANTILKNKVGALSLPNSKTYYKSTVTNMLWYWCKDRHANEWDRIESMDINSYIYG